MSHITRIDVRIKTGNRAYGGTDGDIYLGFCGREFAIDSAIDDFEATSDRLYHLGDGNSVNHGSTNDPRQPQLYTTNLDRFPVYIRFEPTSRTDNWDLEYVRVTVNPDGPGTVKYEALAGDQAGGPNHLWLGVHSGLYCYLTKLP